MMLCTDAIQFAVLGIILRFFAAGLEHVAVFRIYSISAFGKRAFDQSVQG